MAIDFPNSPTTGDTYTAGGRTWQWDGTVWASYGNYPDPTVLKIDTGTNRVGINNTSPTTALDVTGDLTVSGTITGGSISGAGMTVSSSAPSSPSAGEMWYNDTTGRTFVYYNDGSSQQWVEFGVPPEGSTIALASYADAAARTTAIPSPTEADLSYLQDTNSVEVYDGSAWAAVGGKILQVVEASHSTHLTITSTSFTDTGLTATITPTAVGSKVLVIVSQPFALLRSLNNTIVGSMQLVRDATNLQDYHAGTWSSGTDVGGNVLGGFTQAYTYLDSPSTTSAVVYKTQAKVNTTANNGRIYANSDGFGNRPSYMTLLEVAG